jgi:hypothetical protein
MRETGGISVTARGGELLNDECSERGRDYRHSRAEGKVKIQPLIWVGPAPTDFFGFFGALKKGGLFLGGPEKTRTAAEGRGTSNGVECSR